MADTRGQVILVTGPPGAGKSTVSATLAHDFERAVYLRTDAFWDHIVAGAVPPFLPESDQQNATVMTAISRCVHTYAAGGYAVVVDGVIGPWMLHHFRDVAEAERVHYVVLRPTKDVTLSRATARSGPDDLVDPEPIALMWDQFRDLSDRERHVIDTTSHTPEQTMIAIRRALDGDAYLLTA